MNTSNASYSDSGSSGNENSPEFTRRIRRIAVLATVYGVFCIIVLIAIWPKPTIPVDSMFTGARGGCGDISAYRISADRCMAILAMVTKYRNKDGIKQSFSIGTDPNASIVQVYEAYEPTAFEFCSDQARLRKSRYTWKATRGTIEVEYLRGTSDASGAYYVNVRLRDVDLTNTKTGDTAHLKAIDIPEIRVGWFDG